MGLFDWLTGAKPKFRIANDRIWLSKRAKFAGIQQEIAEALAEPGGPDAILVVAHFQDCLDELRSLASSAGFGESRVLVIDSAAVEGWTSGTNLDESRRITIIVAERHPLPSHDDALLKFAQSLPCQGQFVQHISLEEPLLRVFAGQWVEGVLRQLGMKEDQHIESGMVRRRIRQAQQEIAERASGDSPAKSAEEWLEKNCPTR